MATVKPDLRLMAKEAYAAGKLELAMEIYTQAIDVGPATADLYADRALVHIFLGNYADAINDASECIDVDPSIAKGYTRKGAALMKMKKYQTAKKVLELGLCWTNDNSDIARLMMKCDKYIVEDTDQLEDEPMPAIMPKYNHHYYNKPNEVVLTICAKSVRAENIRVHFSERMLNVLIDIPGEEKYQFQPRLPSKIMPKRCSYEILPNEVIIHLEKDDKSYWQELQPQSSMLQCEDSEFSWITGRLNDQDILPHIRDQKKTDTCVFQALSGTGEMELKRRAANLSPPDSSDVKFCTDEFIADYERVHGPIGSDDTKHQRLRTGLAMFREDGVTAEGTGVPKARYRIKDHEPRRNSSFRDIAELIEDGRPVLGSVRLTPAFGRLKSGDIYDPDPAFCMKSDKDVHMSHAVVFIGHGVRNGRAYLVFLNSFGTDYCDGGFGRVYFDRVRRLTTINIDI